MTRLPGRRFGTLLLAGLLTAAACGEPDNPLDESEESIAPAVRTTEQPTFDTTGLNWQRLSNASVTLSSLAGERVTLRGGTFQRQSPSRVVTLEAGILEIDDFDGDRQAEAAVVITILEGLPVPGQLPNPISHLVMFGGSPPLQEAERQLPAGSRVAAIRNNRGILELDLVFFTPGDRACCPSRRETVRYRFSGGSITPM